jgi:Domain of unknown function (DUF4845)
MRRRQVGMTTLGFIVLMVPLAIVFYAGVRLTPIYLNYMNVTHAMKMVASEIPNEGATQSGIQGALEKHLNVSEVTFPDVKDFKVTRTNSVWSIEATYDDQAPLFANIFILVSFDKVEQLKSGGGG